MVSIKNKAVKSFNWILVEGFSSQLITFIIGIILARILSPADFGLVGLITVFIVISNSITDSGLSNALIRKLDASNTDYSTVFFVNICSAIIIYILLFFLAPLISVFFEEPLLKNLIRVSTLVIIINSFVIIQRTLLIKKLNFKVQSIISFISSISSGLVALFMVFNNYGIWSLVFLTLSKQFVNCILLWFSSKWRPFFIFSKSSFKELFNYGYKLLIANLINTIYQNIYYIVIGKFFSTTTLGLFTRADGFQKPFSSNIASGINRVSFPVLSEFQNDDVQLKNKFKRFLRFSILLSSAVLFFILGIAKPLVLILIGEKWYASIYYLKLLCIPGVLYPLQVLNINLLRVKGFSDLNLKLEIIKKFILIPTLFIIAFLGIEALLYGLIVFSIVEFFINSRYTYRLINYSVREQLKDIYPFLIIGLGSSILLSTVMLLKINFYMTICIQTFLAFCYYYYLISTSRIVEFKEIKSIINKFIKLI